MSFKFLCILIKLAYKALAIMITPSCYPQLFSAAFPQSLFSSFMSRVPCWKTILIFTFLSISVQLHAMFHVIELQDLQEEMNNFL